MESVDSGRVGVFGKITDRYFTEFLEHLDKRSIRNTEISNNEKLRQLLTLGKEWKD